MHLKSFVRDSHVDMYAFADCGLWLAARFPRAGDHNESLELSRRWIDYADEQCTKLDQAMNSASINFGRLKDGVDAFSSRYRKTLRGEFFDMGWMVVDGWLCRRFGTSEGSRLFITTISEVDGEHVCIVKAQTNVFAGASS